MVRATATRCAKGPNCTDRVERAGLAGSRHTSMPRGPCTHIANNRHLTWRDIDIAAEHSGLQVSQGWRTRVPRLFCRRVCWPLHSPRVRRVGRRAPVPEGEHGKVHRRAVAPAAAVGSSSMVRGGGRGVAAQRGMLPGGLRRRVAHPLLHDAAVHRRRPALTIYRPPPQGARSRVVGRCQSGGGQTAQGRPVAKD